jgi:ABC-type transporter Mla subunit MlaD
LGTILSTLNSLQNSSDSIAKSVLEQTTGDLTRIFSEYESYLNRLHAQSETLSTSIKESEALLFTLKERSESVVQQMVVVSKNMDKIHANTQEVGDINVPIEKLSSQVSRLEHESITIKDEINAFSKQLETLKKEELAHREHEIEQLSVSLNDKIDATLEKLYEQYHLAQNDISSTVKELASRSKLQQTYLSDSQK